MSVFIIIVLIYAAYHIGHSHANWRHARRLPWYKRVWVSVPGPFNTRISKRF